LSIIRRKVKRDTNQASDGNRILVPLVGKYHRAGAMGDFGGLTALSHIEAEVYHAVCPEQYRQCTAKLFEVMREETV
jgi:hypothetical protein